METYPIDLADSSARSQSSSKFSIKPIPWVKVAIAVIALTAVIMIASGSIAFYLNHGGKLPLFDSLKGLGDPYSISLMVGGATLLASILAVLVYKAIKNYRLSHEMATTPLHEAIRSGKILEVDRLIEEGADLYTRDHKGFTPILLAAEQGITDIIDTLSQKDPSCLEQTDQEGNSLVHIAVLAGHQETVRNLVQRISDHRHLFNKKGQTPIAIAVEKGDLNTLQVLIDEKVEINATASLDGICLHIACRTGNLDVVDLLLKNDSATRVFNLQGLTPLQVAIQHGHHAIVECLLQVKDLDVNMKMRSENVKSALHTAAAYGDVKMMELLLKAGAKLEGNDLNNTPLHEAARYGNVATMKYMLNLPESTALLNQVSAETGLTAVGEAAKAGHVKVLESLCSKGANIKLCAENADMPLFLAIENHHDSASLVLIKHLSKDDLFVANQAGRSPLHEAIYQGMSALVAPLIEKGADLEVLDSDQKTPVALAVEKDDLVSRKLLEKALKNLEKNKNR